MLGKRPPRPIIIGAALTLLFTTPALATFHLWDINEIYTNADGTIQFIEFTTTFGNQQFLTGEQLSSDSNLFTFPSNLPGSTANKSFLMATSGFAALPGAVTPDYIMPDNFFAVTGGDTLTLVDSPSNADQITFGAGMLPTDGLLSLNRNMTTGTNSPTNFAGAPGQIDLSGPSLDPANVFVKFDADPGGTGTEGMPFDTLQAALDAAVPPATINLEPGTTDETFSGVDAISTELTLLNNTPAGGPVQIGVSAKSTGSRSGFRSKPIAPGSPRSGAP